MYLSQKHLSIQRNAIVQNQINYIYTFKISNKEQIHISDHSAIRSNLKTDLIITY